MIDETHRRFYSGRFGAEQPAAIEPEFNTQIAAAPSVSVNKKKKKEDDEEDTNETSPSSGDTGTFGTSEGE